MAYLIWGSMGLFGAFYGNLDIYVERKVLGGGGGGGAMPLSPLVGTTTLEII